MLDGLTLHPKVAGETVPEFGEREQSFLSANQDTRRNQVI